MAKTIDLNTVSKMDFPLAINRQAAFPLDFSSYFTSKQLADRYAAEGGNSYVGQIITVVEGGKVDIYKINASGALELIGSSAMYVGAGAPPTDAKKYEQGALYLNTTDNHLYVNTAVKSVAASWVRLVNDTDLQDLGGGDMVKSVWEGEYSRTEKPGYVDNAVSADKASTADKLTTARNIELSGDVTGTASFDGSSHINIEAALSNVVEAGTYVKVTTDTKGRVTKGEVKLAQSDVTGLPEKLTELEQADTALGQRIDTVQDAVTALGQKNDYVLKAGCVSNSAELEQYSKNNKNDKQAVVKLAADGLIDMSLLPAFKLSNVFNATSYENITTAAAGAEPGDLCCVGPESGPIEVYILTKAGAGVSGNWKKLSSMDDVAVEAIVDRKLISVNQGISDAKAAASAAQSTADTAKSTADANATKITTIEKQIPSFVVNTEILILQGGKADGTYDIK